MSGNGAFEQEMRALREITDGDEELNAFAHELRATLVAPPAGAVATALPARLAAEARAAAPSVPTAPTAVNGKPHRARPARRPLLARPLLRIALAIAAIPLLFSGLAIAGVDLPDPATAPFESVGIDLPNQGGDDDVTGGAANDDDTEGSANDGDSAGSKTGQDNSSGKLGHGQEKENPARVEETPGKGKTVGTGRPPPDETETDATADEEGKAEGKPETPPDQGQSNSQGNGPPESPGSQGKAPGGVQKQGSDDSQVGAADPGAGDPAGGMKP